jgi:Fic family protein
MFNPKYEITPRILTHIAKVERLYGRLESLKIPQTLELNLERDHLIKSSYISNSIEGNPLSLPEVTNLLLGGRVPANRDEKEVKNYFDILKSLPEYRGKQLDLQTILLIHKELLQGVDEDIAGKIRCDRVVVGQKLLVDSVEKIEIKHEPPFHTSQEIVNALAELTQWVGGQKQDPAVLRAGIFHHQFVYLHPFTDGNGRTCRLLTTLFFLNEGFNINKYFILDDYYDIDRSMYSDKLHSADFGDKTEWLEYFISGVEYSLQSALAKLETQVDLLPLSQRLSTREKEVLKLLQERKELSSEILAEVKNVSRQQAQNLLSKLVEKGFAQKEGTTKGSYYKLK